MARARDHHVNDRVIDARAEYEPTIERPRDDLASDRAGVIGAIEDEAELALELGANRQERATHLR
jgi:hypothetical protein